MKICQDLELPEYSCAFPAFPFLFIWKGACSGIIGFLTEPSKGDMQYCN